MRHSMINASLKSGFAFFAAFVTASSFYNADHCTEMLPILRKVKRPADYPKNFSIFKCWDEYCTPISAQILAHVVSHLPEDQTAQLLRDSKKLFQFFKLCIDNNIQCYSAFDLFQCNDELIPYLLENGLISNVVNWRNRADSLRTDKLEKLGTSLFLNFRNRLWYAIGSPLLTRVEITKGKHDKLIAYLSEIQKSITKEGSEVEKLLFLLRLRTISRECLASLSSKKREELRMLWQAAVDDASLPRDKPLARILLKNEIFETEGTPKTQNITRKSYKSLLNFLEGSLLEGQRLDTNAFTFWIIELACHVQKQGIYSSLTVNRPLVADIEVAVLQMLKRHLLHDKIPEWFIIFAKALFNDENDSIGYVASKVRSVYYGFYVDAGMETPKLVIDDLKSRKVPEQSHLFKIIMSDPAQMFAFFRSVTIEESGVFNLVPTERQELAKVEFEDILTTRAWHIMTSASASHELRNLIKYGEVQFLTNGMNAGNPKFIYYWVTTLFEKAVKEGMLVLLDSRYLTIAPDVSREAAFIIGILLNLTLSLGIADPTGLGFPFHPQLINLACLYGDEADATNYFGKYFNSSHLERHVIKGLKSDVLGFDGTMIGRGFFHGPLFTTNLQIYSPDDEDAFVEFKGKPLQIFFTALPGNNNFVEEEREPKVLLPNSKQKIITRNWSRAIINLIVGIGVDSDKWDTLHTSVNDFQWIEDLMAPCLDQNIIANSLEFKSPDATIESLGSATIKVSAVKVIEEFVHALDSHQAKVFVEVLVGASLNEYALKSDHIHVKLSSELTDFETMPNPFTIPQPDDLNEIVGEVHFAQLKKIYETVWNKLEGSFLVLSDEEFLAMMPKRTFVLQTHIKSEKVLVPILSANDLFFALAASISRTGYHKNFKIGGKLAERPKLYRDPQESLSQYRSSLEMYLKKYGKVGTKEELSSQKVLRRQKKKKVPRSEKEKIKHEDIIDVEATTQDETQNNHDQNQKASQALKVENTLQPSIDSEAQEIHNVESLNSSFKKLEIKEKKSAQLDELGRIEVNKTIKIELEPSIVLGHDNPWKPKFKRDNRIDPSKFIASTLNARWLNLTPANVKNFPWGSEELLERHQRKIAEEIFHLQSDVIVVNEVQNFEVLEKVTRIINEMVGREDYYAYMAPRRGGEAENPDLMKVGLITRIDPSSPPRGIDDFEPYPAEGFDAFCKLVPTAPSSKINYDDFDKFYPNDNGKVRVTSIPRSLIATFEVFAGGALHQIAIIGAHLKSGVDDCLAIAVREAQALMISSEIELLRRLGYLIILAGDLNDTDFITGNTEETRVNTGSRTLGILRQSGLFQTNWQYPKPQKFTWKGGKTLDYILSDQRFESPIYEIRKPYPTLEDVRKHYNENDSASDHFGVRAEFNLENFRVF